MTTIYDFLWRVACALEYLRRLGPGQCWDLAGNSLAQQREWRAHGVPFDSPSAAVSEELSYWSE